MTITYQARALTLSDIIEDEVDIEILDLQPKCFAGICPYPIEMGKIYPVCLELLVLDSYEVEEASSDVGLSFSRLEEGFAYLVRGRLNGKHLEVGRLIFENEILQRDFGYMDGKYLELRVDRINVEFLY
jgi:hypothetical protein